MKEELIIYETAVLAKQKGFTIKTKHWYDQTGSLEPTRGPRAAMCYINIGYAPTQALLQRWLRQVYKLTININWVYAKFNEIDWCYSVKGINKINNNVLPHNELRFNTYEEALERGLQEALKLIE